MNAIQDGKLVKLRAACDGCNESKVRCSQTRPSCVRCMRQGVPCIYGLSRRSHRKAPRVGASSANMASHLTNNLDASLLHLSGIPSSAPGGISGTEPGTIMASVLGTNDDSSTANLEGLLALQGQQGTQPFMPTMMENLPAFDSYIRSLTDSNGADFLSSLEPAFNFNLDALMEKDDTDESTLWSAAESDCSMPRPGSREEEATVAPSSSRSEEKAQSISCSCNHAAVQELLVIPFQPLDQMVDMDATMSRLKQAVKVADECVGCVCITQDEMSIVMACALIGRIIQAFEIYIARNNNLKGIDNTASNVLNESSSPGHSPPHTSSSSQNRWGGLHIDPDEEVELKQHLLLIQLRKLQAVTKNLGVAGSYLRQLHNRDASVFMFACQCMHIWLSRKVQALHDGHSSNNTDSSNSTGSRGAS